MSELNNTESKVFALLDELTAQGKEIPSQRVIRHQIGGGSPNTISLAVKAWRQSRGMTADVLLNASETASNKIREELSASVWKVFTSAFRERVLPIKAEYEKLLAQYKKQCIDITFQRDEAISELKISKEKLQQAESRIEQLNLEIEELHAQLKEFQDIFNRKS